MRLVRTIGVLLMIVAFPALSWFYLNRGADWRIKGLEEISEKTALDAPATALVSASGEPVGALEGNYIIAVNRGGEDLSGSLGQIQTMFSHREDLLLLLFEDERSEQEDWISLDCSDQGCRQWKAKLFDGPGNTVLIDAELNLRNRYDIGIKDEYDQLIEQAVILLPVERREKIELRRGSN